MSLHPEFKSTCIELSEYLKILINERVNQISKASDTSSDTSGNSNESFFNSVSIPKEEFEKIKKSNKSEMTDFFEKAKKIPNSFPKNQHTEEFKKEELNGNRLIKKFFNLTRGIFLEKSKLTLLVYLVATFATCKTSLNCDNVSNPFRFVQFLENLELYKSKIKYRLKDFFEKLK